MVRITEELIRKRSEHNEGLVSTLEELSLHQQDIEKIENIDKWCRDLRILYLQSNLIPKIENVGRLKKLEYLNLALNNIEIVENLEGCESLNKLDFTVNFIGELTSIESLKQLVHLRELFLTGNPCTEYEGYWQYVVATLPQLQYLDGKEIEKSDRIRATQILHEVRPQILEQQRKYRLRREKEKAEATAEKSQQTEHGEGVAAAGSQTDMDEDAEKRFWEEKTSYTPESRIKIHEHLQATKHKDDSISKESTVKIERKLESDDGRMLNVNEAKVDFSLTETDDGSSLLLDISVFRHLDTALVSLDVQPTYVRIYIKGKVFQLVLNEEVRPSISHALRSQTTGHLLVTMPKVNPVLKTIVAKKKPVKVAETTDKQLSSELQHLEVDPAAAKLVDVGNIVSSKHGRGDVTAGKPLTSSGASWRSEVKERPNSAEFVDDTRVPPLE